VASVAERVSMNGMIAVGSIAAVGVALTFVLVFTSSQYRARRKRQQSEKRLSKDPVTQPIVIQQEPSQFGKKTSGKEKSSQDGARVVKPVGTRLPSVWPLPIWSRAGNSSAKGNAVAPACLVALDENEQPITGGAIPLIRQEITFGADPQQANHVLESPTVNDLHARLYRSPDGAFYLVDEGSVAGTWINYTPASSSGIRLEHGDLVHIGMVMFRFELANPSPVDIKVVNLQ
jgi:hypothetical protein